MGTQQEQALATVVVVTKDEYDLIDDFLSYHSAIFGPENVVVVDNGSTDARLVPVYRRHRDAGVRFVSERRPFVGAAGFMTEHMRSLAPRCRFLLPLETDEFLFLTDGREMLLPAAEMREAVLGHLRGVPDDVSVLRYGAFLGSCVDPSDAGYSRGAYDRPAARITGFRDQGWDKLIVRASTFDRMTLWCHHAACTSGSEAKSDLLGLLHFHEIGRRRRVERALPVVRSYRMADPERDTDAEQLSEGRRVIPFGLACGHKLEYYCDHLARLETLRAFRRHLGRLPSSAEEMRAFSEEGATPDALVRRAVSEGRLARGLERGGVDGPSWEDLLYAEEKHEPEVTVRQVAHALGFISDRS